MTTNLSEVLGDTGNRILEILQNYKIAHLHVHPEISSKKNETAKKHYQVPIDEIPIAIYDSTSFGTGTNGVFFGVRGMYWNNDSLSERPGTDHISYEDLTQSEMRRKNVYEVAVSCRQTEKLILGYVGQHTKPSRELQRLLYLLKYGLTNLREVPVDQLPEKIHALALPYGDQRSGPERVFVDGLIKYGAWVIAAALIYYICKLILK